MLEQKTRSSCCSPAQAQNLSITLSGYNVRRERTEKWDSPLACRQKEPLQVFPSVELIQKYGTPPAIVVLPAITVCTNHTARRDQYERDFLDLVLWRYSMYIPGLAGIASWWHLEHAPMDVQENLYSEGCTVHVLYVRT